MERKERKNKMVISDANIMGGMHLVILGAGASIASCLRNPELHAIEANAEMDAQMKADFEVAKHRAPNGKEYTTAHAWKFNSLLWEWKKENPMEK